MQECAIEGLRRGSWPVGANDAALSASILLPATNLASACVWLDKLRVSQEADAHASAAAITTPSNV